MNKLLKMILIALVISSSISSGSIFANNPSSPLKYVKQPWDVQAYNIDITCKPTEKTINGTCLINVRQDTISADNYFYFQLNGLRVNKVFLNDKETQYTVSNETSDMQNYAVKLSDAKDSNFTLKVEYSGTPIIEAGKGKWGGVHFKNDLMFNMGVGFYNPNISAGSYWFPCYDHPSDKAKYTINIKVADSLTVAASGKLISEKKIDGGLKEFLWQGDVPAATYMLSFAIGKLETISIAGTSVPNLIYAKSNSVEKAKSGLKLLPKMIDCFTKNYGEYPFEKVGYVLTPIGSMEHQTMIAIDENVLTPSDPSSKIAAHELAHSWFGGSVTPLDFRDAWLNEGFATFSEALWLEYLASETPEEASLKFKGKILQNAYSFTGSSSSNAKNSPLYNFSHSDLSNYPELIYDKGAVVVAMLREELGDSLFFGGIKHYLKKNKLSNINTAILKKDLEEFAGRDITQFFEQWIYGACFPQVELTVNKNNYPDNKFCKVDVLSKQVQSSPCPMFKNYYIDISFLDGNKYVYDKKLVFNSPEGIVSIDSVPNYEKARFNVGRASVSLFTIKKITSDVEDSFANSSAPHRIFPEASRDLINIGGAPIDAPIVIYNVLGQKIRILDYTNRIDISDLDNSLYVLQIGNNFYKFIKL